MDKKILSFDGGGLRGVISLSLLMNLEKELGASMAEHADVIAGTSTGSIIAGALAIGMRPEDLLHFYTSMGEDVFKPNHSLDRFLNLKAKYSSDTLHSALESAFTSKGISPQTPLSALNKELVIPMVSLDDKKMKRWRTEILTHKSDIPLIDAIMASTAAPTYFPSYQNHIDGGMAANDPSAAAYAASGGAKAVLSFGTGYTSYKLSKGEDWGAFSWVIDLHPNSEVTKTPLLTMLFDIQDQLSGQLCELMIGERYKRLNFELPEPVRLDDVSKIPFLIEKAEQFIKENGEEWKTTCKWAEKQFMQ